VRTGAAACDEACLARMVGGEDLAPGAYAHKRRATPPLPPNEESSKASAFCRCHSPNPSVLVILRHSTTGS
jgi:hypothetical protein